MVTLANFRRRCDSCSDMREFTDNSIQKRSCNICIKRIEAYAPERSSIYRFDVYANGGDGERFCWVKRCAPPIPNSARGFRAINSRFRRRLATVSARPICSSCPSRDATFCQLHRQSVQQREEIFRSEQFSFVLCFEFIY